MLKKPLVRWLALLLLIVTVAGVMFVSAAEPTPVNADGLVLEKMPIVLPAGATDVEKSAAKELQHYLKELTGKSSSIITETANAGSAIYIGATKFAAAANVTYTDNNGLGEGWAIKAVDGSLVITGGATRGVLYGVYHLLEDEFGVHWWNMWEEYVPELESAVVPADFASSGEPLFANRDIYTNESYTSLFFVRNRLNGFAGNAPQEYGGEVNFARPYHVHTFNRYFPAYYTAPTNEDNAKWIDAINPDGINWYEEHPKWYAWSEARQENIAYGQMCLSNEEFLGVFIEKVLLAIEMSYEEADAAGVPRPKYVDISPNDMPGHCECEKCLASKAASGESGHLLKFINKMAAAIAEVYPEITVETLAYWHYFEVPTDTTVPADNVVIRLANSDMDVAHRLSHKNNKQVYDRIEAWRAITKPGQLWLWDYGIVLTNHGVLPSYFRWFDDYRYAYEKGFMGVLIEHQRPNVTEFWDLKEWLIAKAMEDPYQDVEALTMEFLSCYYGKEAAEPLYAYLKHMEKAAEDHYETITFADDTVDAPWLDALEVLEGNGYFEAALKAIREDETLSATDRDLYLERINAARGSLDRVILENYNRFVEEASAAGATFDLGRQEVGTRMIDGLTWLRNMENEVDYTGLENYGSRGRYGGTNEINKYNKYLTESDPITGDLMERPAIPQAVYDDHPGISDNHIHDFLASNFFQAGVMIYYPFVDLEYGAASFKGGSAVTVDYDMLFDWTAEYGGGTSTYTFSETKAMIGTIPNLYLGDPIINDGEYHLYYVPDVEVLNKATTLFSFFHDVIRFNIQDLRHLANEPVDVYLSMKLEGDPSGEDLNNLGKLYIDRIIIVEDCTNYDVTYTDEIPATCASNKKLVGICPVCGEDAVKELPYTKAYHDIVGDYRYDAASGKYYADCRICGEAVFDTKGELPEGFIEALASEGISLEGVYDFAVKDFTVSTSKRTTIESDEDSILGKTVHWDLTNLPENMYFYFKMTDSKRMFFPSKVTDAPYAKDIVTDGEYHLYKLSDVPLVQEGDSKLIFMDWSLQLDAKSLEHLMDRKVDVYFSMKVEGDLGFFDGVGDSLHYYIDRILVVAGCASHSAETYTWDAAQQAYIGKCDNCNRVVKHAFQAELPQDVFDALAESKSDLAHVHEYSSDSFILAGSFKEVADTESVFGKAVKLRTYDAASNPNKFIGKNLPIIIYGAASGYTDVGTIKVAELGKNANKGYKFYKYEDVQLPEAKMNYLYMFDFYLQNHDMAADMNDLLGKTVDIYVSMKIEGDPVNGKSAATCPSYYVDRMLLVDSCGNNISEANMTLKSEATCWQGDTYDGICAVCGRVSELEVESTRLPHNFGPYETDPVTGKQIAKCTNDGCTYVKTVDFEAELPDAILEDLRAAGTNMEHVHDFGPSTFKMGTSSVLSLVEDKDSPYGEAICIPDDYSKFSSASEKASYLNGWNYASMRLIALAKGGEFVYMNGQEMKNNIGKGYHVYKFNDVKLPEVDGSYRFVQMFNGPIQNWEIAKKMDQINGSVVDFYVSMKITGQFGNQKNPPVYYIDRMVVVDDCSNYEIEYTAPEGTSCVDKTVTYTGYCPACDKKFTKPGDSVSLCSFTTYMRDKFDNMKYVAYCDNGCGTMDVKYDERLPMDARLPEELPQSAKNHLLFAYSCSDYQLSGVEDCYFWDLELDRPVGVLDYANNYESDYMIYTGSEGVMAGIYAQDGSDNRGLGHFINVKDGTGVAGNTGKGYQLYVIEDVMPVKDGNYTYYYMFDSWVLQIQMLDDDLVKAGYRNKAVDLYLYMKVEGDTSTMGEDKPVYTIDQIIVAGSCTTDDTWVTTKDATCAEFGQMEGTCTTCGLDTVLVLPKLRHVMTNSIREYEPTCKRNEYRYGKCDVCGESETIEIPGTMLQHQFTNYVLQEDKVTEIAYCDLGCGTRDKRTVSQPGDFDDTMDGITDIIGSVTDVVEDIFGIENDNEENTMDMLPILGGAGGGDSQYYNGFFTDVTESDWYYEEVKEAWENGLIDGVTAAEYRPNETLTVAQAIKLAAAFHEMYFTGSVSLKNGSTNWYDTYVTYAIEARIIDSKYASYSAAQMNKAIDRAEFVSIFVNAMNDAGLVGYNSVADNAIPDVKMDDEAAEAIYKFYRAGILTGSDAKGTFNPESSIKRSEVAAILSRMYNEGSRQAITLG